MISLEEIRINKNSLISKREYKTPVNVEWKNKISIGRYVSNTLVVGLCICDQEFAVFLSEEIWSFANEMQDLRDSGRQIHFIKTKTKILNFLDKKMIFRTNKIL